MPMLKQLTRICSIFPGLGLGAILSKCSTIPEALIHTSADALASSVTKEEKAEHMLYPKLERIREVSAISRSTLARLTPLWLTLSYSRICNHQKSPGARSRRCKRAQEDVRFRSAELHHGQHVRPAHSKSPFSRTCQALAGLHWH